MIVFPILYVTVCSDAIVIIIEYKKLVYAFMKVFLCFSKDVAVFIWIEWIFLAVNMIKKSNGISENDLVFQKCWVNNAKDVQGYAEDVISF